LVLQAKSPVKVFSLSIDACQRGKQLLLDFPDNHGIVSRLDCTQCFFDKNDPKISPRKTRIPSGFLAHSLHAMGTI